METPSNKNFLFFVAPIVGVIIGIALLLSPATAGLFGNAFSSSQDGGYTYYNKTISADELTKLEAEKEVFTVHYTQPVDGAMGSVWDTQEEANEAEAKYRETYGDAHGLMAPGTSPDDNAPPGETTSITQ